MYGDKTTSRERVTTGKKGEAMHKALNAKIDKGYMKQGIKEAHKKAKKLGYLKEEKF